MGYLVKCVDHMPCDKHPDAPKAPGGRKCLVCHKEYHKAYGKKYRNSERGREYNRRALRRKRRECDYDEPSPTQPCAICCTVTKLDYDHCHETGLHRGWICRRCNLALGLLGDSFERVVSALNYMMVFVGGRAERLQERDRSDVA